MNLPEGDLVVVRLLKSLLMWGLAQFVIEVTAHVVGTRSSRYCNPRHTGLNRCDFTKMLPPKAVLDLVLGMPTLRNRV